MAASAQSPAMPRFDDYPAHRTFAGTPAAPQLETASYGRSFRTRLREGARTGPNFAGTFTVVIWGCGAPCQMVAVIDAQSGRLSTHHLHTENGVEFRANSRLIVADPKRPGDPAGCVSCGTEAAYEWTGTEFRPIGPGEHPHVTTFN